MDSKNNFKVIGLMSGTSLDGVDIACCNFKRSDGAWRYNIQAAQTVRYSPAWNKKLSGAHLLTGEQLVDLDAAYGKHLGLLCAAFVKGNKIRAVDFIASHGHTVFHQPQKGFTCQIGNGNAIHAGSGLPVVWDFRSLDVMLGGQGAPLVPAGDKFLFSAYDICLNLGGIANLSMDVGGARKAFDICFANMGLNYLAAKTGKAFDTNGNISSRGELNKTMFRALTKIYGALRRDRPSLGREFFERKVQPLLDNEAISIADRLHTFTESIAAEIAAAIPPGRIKKNMLCTGGGAFNTFLMSRLLEHCETHTELILPDEDIVKFKEALVFAFLGVLRVIGQHNCLKSVTGASRDNTGGVAAGW